jgi:DNA-directed RNA polymerase subunit M/transcription elongation factor TFIIS
MDKFDKYREELGADKIDNFLAKFGMGPNYKPEPTQTHMCPHCHNKNASYIEVHPDTDMNEIVLDCPDCGYEG